MDILGRRAALPAVWGREHVGGGAKLRIAQPTVSGGSPSSRPGSPSAVLARGEGRATPFGEGCSSRRGGWRVAESSSARRSASTRRTGRCVSRPRRGGLEFVTPFAAWLRTSCRPSASSSSRRACTWIWCGARPTSRCGCSAPRRVWSSRRDHHRVGAYARRLRESKARLRMTDLDWIGGPAARPPRAQPSARQVIPGSVPCSRRMTHRHSIGRRRWAWCDRARATSIGSRSGLVELDVDLGVLGQLYLLPPAARSPSRGARRGRPARRRDPRPGAPTRRGRSIGPGASFTFGRGKMDTVRRCTGRHDPSLPHRDLRLREPLDRLRLAADSDPSPRTSRTRPGRLLRVQVHRRPTRAAARSRSLGALRYDIATQTETLFSTIPRQHRSGASRPERRVVWHTARRQLGRLHNDSHEQRARITTTGRSGRFPPSTATGSSGRQPTATTQVRVDHVVRVTRLRAAGGSLSRTFAPRRPGLARDQASSGGRDPGRSGGRRRRGVTWGASRAPGRRRADPAIAGGRPVTGWAMGGRPCSGGEPASRRWMASASASATAMAPSSPTQSRR